MKAEHTIDKPARAGRATQIAAMVITGLVALIWVYFGRLYLIHDPDEWRIANQQLGYPLYIIPLIGVTHILGGVGLLIPNVPRLTEWVYAGLAIDLLLAFYSHLNGGGSTWRSDSRHGVRLCFVCIKTLHAGKQVVDMKNTLGWVAHPSFFLASTTAIVGAPSMTQLHRGMGGTAPQPTPPPPQLSSPARTATGGRYRFPGAGGG